MDEKINNMIPEHVQLMKIVVPGQAHHDDRPVKDRMIDVAPLPAGKNRFLEVLPGDRLHVDVFIPDQVDRIIVMERGQKRIAISDSDQCYENSDKN